MNIKKRNSFDLKILYKEHNNYIAVLSCITNCDAAEEDCRPLLLDRGLQEAGTKGKTQHRFLYCYTLL
jgi:hypothetical protein